MSSPKHEDLVMIEEAVLALSQPGEQFTKARMSRGHQNFAHFLRKGPGTFRETSGQISKIWI